MAARGLPRSTLLAASISFALVAAGQPASLDQIAKQAAAETAAGATRRAIELLQGGLEREPGWKHGLWAISIAGYQSGDYALARTHLGRLLAINSKAGEAWALLGLCDFELRDYSAAAQHLQRGMAAGIPAQLDLADVARFRRASAEIMLRNYDTAQWILLGLCNAGRSGTEREELIESLGIAALRIPLLLPAGKLPLDTETLVRSTGEALFRGAAGDAEGASRLFAEIVAKYPNTPNVHYANATFLLDQANYASAEAELRRELTVDSKSFIARLGLAYAGLHAGEISDYLIFAVEAADMKPDSYLAHVYLGRLLMKAGRAEEALAQLQKARDLSPFNSKVHFFLAGAYQMLGKPADAKRERDEFTRLQPASDRASDSRN